MDQNSYYPWDTWLDGNRHTIQKGQHFACEASSMVAQLYTKAKTRGIKVSVHREGDSITFFRKPILTAVVPDYYKVEEFVMANEPRISEQANRRHTTFGEFLTEILDDVLGVYENQSDEFLESLYDERQSA